MQMTDPDWLRLCVYMEARGEIDDGKAAVAKVVLNRVARRYNSGDTIMSAVTWPSQFSWCEFEMVDGHYIRVCEGLPAIEARAATLMTRSLADNGVWNDCAAIADQVVAETYRGGRGYQALTPETLLYANLAISRPSWIENCTLVQQIDHHSFFAPSLGHAAAVPAKALTVSQSVDIDL